MSIEIDELKKLLKDNFHRFVFYGSENHYVKLPVFDLYPRDYLGYAESSIANGDTKQLIECVGHLKRAMDCQIDVFLNAFGLGNYFKKRKLGVDIKLGFLRSVGVFDSRTLTKLNTVRNRMEHRYEIPKTKMEEIEVYYDLVSGFVSILESSILLLRYEKLVFTNEIDVSGERVEMGEGDEEIWISYDFEKANINIGYQNIPERQKKLKQSWKERAEKDPDWLNNKGNDSHYYDKWFKDSGGIFKGWSATPSSDYDNFVYYFRVFNLLAQKEAVASDKYILARL